MAAFVCFSNSKEKTTDSYKEFIQRLHRETQKELVDKPPKHSAVGFKFYSSQKNKKRQYVFKEFIYHLRMKMFEGTCILLCENPTPTFKCFIRLIERLKLQNGTKSNAYYGEIKNIITGFMNYFTFVIDETTKKIDDYTHALDNKLFVKLIDDTIEIHERNQTAFLKEYLPLDSESEKEKYQQVIDGQAKFLTELGQIRETWEFRQDKLDVFAKESFEASIKKISDLCNFTHTFISTMLTDRLYEISVSITETVGRMNSNLRQYKQNSTDTKNMLIQKLYEENKKHLELSRRLYQRSADTAEVNRTIEVLKEKIEHCGNDENIARLIQETRYWNKRMKDFEEIASVLVSIRVNLDELEEDQEKYKNIKCLELPGSKSIAFELIGENINEKISYLQEKQLKMSRALITFFCVRGTDRILYTDSVGSYYVDEFNHQNYITNYGLKYFHVNCYGEFLENSENTPYYFDENGRYTLNEKGEKIHQVAPCTSQYKLNEDGLFTKITKDCGHSEKANPNCRLDIKDLTDGVILPKNDPIDITGTLDRESVKYLWETFGMVLPEVLHVVAKKQPKNPIHFMAHLLLKRRFRMSSAEFRNLRKIAEQYRNNVHQKRKDKAIMETLAWKAKLIKRCKPEDLDDSQERAAYNQQVAADWLIINSMSNYN